MRRARWAYDRDRREWRHLDASGMETTLLYALRGVDCRRCGVRTESVPWADPGLLASAGTAGGLPVGVRPKPKSGRIPGQPGGPRRPPGHLQAIRC